MQFTNCIINANYIPVGFTYVNNGVERYEDFASLCRRNASDGRITFSESGVFGLYKYDKNEIKICRETADGGYSAPIDPGITLTQRIISGGKVVGYVVKDGTGNEVKKRIDSILSAAKYLKPTNFKVVERDGRRFLQGIAGTALNELPTIDLTPVIDAPTKPKTERVEPHDVVNPNYNGGTSLISLFDIVNECGGCILKLPSDTYKPVGSVLQEDADDFTRLKNACEIAPPVLSPSTKKLSASLKYKCPGAVMLSDGSATIAYIHRDKNIINVHYENGTLRGDKVRLGRIGIAIPQENVKKFYSAIAGTVAISPLQDKVAAKSAVKLAKIANPELLEAIIDELPILGAKYTESLLAGEQIKSVLLSIMKYKYVSSFAASIKKGLLAKGVTAEKNVWGNYAQFSQPILDELKEQVDIYSGMFNEVKTGANSGGKGKTRTNSSAIAQEQNVEIIYKLTEEVEIPKDVNTVMGMSLDDLPENVRPLLAMVINEPVEGKKLTLAEKTKQQSDSVIKQFEMQLFKHKIAMLLDGSNTVHSHDSFEWSSEPVTSRAQFTKHKHSCGIYVTLRNIAMKK